MVSQAFSVTDGHQDITTDEQVAAIQQGNATLMVVLASKARMPLKVRLGA